MPDNGLDFAPIPTPSERTALLLEAAERLDLLRSTMGPGDIQETDLGALVRDLTQDVAEFAAYPEVYRITDASFLKRDLPVPPRFTELTRNARFSWLYLPVALFPRRRWAFNRLEVAVDFNRGQEPAQARPKAHEIFPAKRFQELLAAGAGVDIGLDGRFELAAQTGPIQVDLGGAGARADAAAGVRLGGNVGMALGPFRAAVRIPRIDHTPVGMESVRWRLDGAQLFGQEDPHLIVILKVPKLTRQVRVEAFMRAYRYFRLAPAGLQAAVQHLPQRLREFLRTGAPMSDAKEWDITKEL